MANPVKPKNLFIYTMNELPTEKSQLAATNAA